MRLVVVLFLSIDPILGFKPCIEEKTKHGVVCVCNSSYCDTVPDWDPAVDLYGVYTTSRLKAGLRLSEGRFLPNGSTTPFQSTIFVDLEKQYQSIIGWGGAFTDATGININSLPKKAQNNLLESYFGLTGIGYSMGRVVVGGSDFSTRPYSYDDHPMDLNLAHFQLQNEDFQYKIPHILEAKRRRKGLPLKLFASAWSAPVWMKTNHIWTGPSLLQSSFYQLWADYFIKFFREYRKFGIDFWGMTTGNEPLDGFSRDNMSQLIAMGWTASGMNQWVGYNLGPTLRFSEFSHLKLILHDDNRPTLPFLPLQLENPLTVYYADGVGIHWYSDQVLPDYYLDYTVSTLKDLFLLATEACNGFLHIFNVEEAVHLGSWQRAENYINSIFLDLSYRSAGWIDWNMVLNLEGGPTYIKNFVDSPIIVNNKTGVFYKQPMFYALGHFSKFVVPDSRRLETNLGPNLDGVKAMAFLRPDNIVVLVIFNQNPSNITIQADIKGKLLEEVLQGNSLNTILVAL